MYVYDIAMENGLFVDDLLHDLSDMMIFQFAILVHQRLLLFLWLIFTYEDGSKPMNLPYDGWT